MGYVGQRDDSPPMWEITSHSSECAQFKIYELLISVIFHLIFSDDDGPETTGIENAGNRELL